MSYSLDVFAYRELGDLSPGTVFADEDGRWYMAARLTGRTENMALRLDSLEGEHTVGNLVSSLGEKVFAVTDPYSTSIHVGSLSDLRISPDGPFPGSIMLASPPAIYGVSHERRLIGLNGLEINEGTVHRRRARYLRWSVWLIDPSGRKVGEEPLVSVDVSRE